MKTARIEVKGSGSTEGAIYVMVYINNRLLGVSSRSYQETLFGLYSYHFEAIKLPML